MGTDDDWLELNSLLCDDIDKAQLACEIAAPCPGADVLALAARARRELKCDLPAGYLSLLRLTDGLSCNGGTFYGSRPRTIVIPPDPFDPGALEQRYEREGIIEASLQLRGRGGVHARSVVFGDWDLDFFEWQPERDRYGLVGKVSGECSESFDTFDAMLRRQLPPFIVRILALGIRRLENS